MKNQLLTLLWLGLTFPAWATYNLQILNPRVSAWYGQKGTIEEAVLAVRPQGLYMEYGLYLTFSARGTNYKPSDSLEVVLDFDLPSGAIVHDSWLWINNSISRARILDRWKASSIYEATVKRRQDPSILVKNSSTQYQLRVFPMGGEERRKVKITYLVPANWSRSSVECDLPVAILKTSRYPLAAFNILTWMDDDWKNPIIVDKPWLAFSAKTDLQFGPYHALALRDSSLVPGTRIAFNAPFHNGVYLRTLPDAPAGFYQLAVMPAQLIADESERKILIIIDHEEGAGSLSAATVMGEMKRRLLQELTPRDSFNILVSGISPKLMSAHWLKADSFVIAQTFQSAGTSLVNLSNLPSALSKGIDFIQTQGNKGAIFLATNSTHYGGVSSANLLLKKLTVQMGTSAIAIYTLNHNDSYTLGQYVNNIYYYASEYFLINLSKLTGGNFESVRAKLLPEVIQSAVSSLGTPLRSYDFYTTMATGYCFGRYNLGVITEEAYMNKPLLQIGKYQGDFPFRIDLDGELNGNFVSATRAISASEAGASDTLNREMWYGNYLRQLEGLAATNVTVSDIVDGSIAERVLSRYTAFLCLDDPTQFCPECQDETQLVNTSDPVQSDSLFRAWPNPFSDRITIEIKAGAGAAFDASASLEIYNAGGHLLRQFRLTEAQNGTARVEWDGRDLNGGLVPAGAYVGVARVNKGRQAVLKLVKKT